MQTILIIGCGYIGRRVAKLELVKGSKALALARSEQSARSLEELGIQAVRGNLDDPESLKGLPVSGTTLYYFAPPPSHGQIDSRMETLVSNVTFPDLPKRVVLIITTGIYGDCQGRWINEDEPPNPQTDRAHRRLATETTLRQWSEAEKVPIVILRVPGIYGPDRLPKERLTKGEPVLREEDAPFSNRIHADDLARACVAAAESSQPGTVYNVNDGHPTTMTDFFYRVADLLCLPRPPAITMKEARQKLSPEMLSYLTESKRIKNRRMQAELSVHPNYPDLASGLPSCLINK